MKDQVDEIFRYDSFPLFARKEFLDRVYALSMATYERERDIEGIKDKLSSLKALEGNLWSRDDRYYKQELEWEICKGSLILSVFEGDRYTFTSNLHGLKKFYRRALSMHHPSPVKFTLMRLNLVKALLDDKSTDPDFHAEVEFIVKVHGGRYEKGPLKFDQRFTASDVINLLLQQESTSMEEEACGSQSRIGMQDIIKLCEKKLNVYINKNGLPWEMDKGGLLVSIIRAEEEESLEEDVRSRQVINEALAYLRLLEWKDQQAAVDNLSCINSGCWKSDPS